MNIFLHGRSLLFKDTIAKIQKKWNHSKHYPYFIYNKPFLFSTPIMSSAVILVDRLQQ